MAHCFVANYIISSQAASKTVEATIYGAKGDARVRNVRFRADGGAGFRRSVGGDNVWTFGEAGTR